MATYSRKLKDASGNYIAPATRSKVVYFDDNTTLNKLTFYPVGSIYQSTSSTSPASLFGGSWEKIQGRFLLGSSSSYSVSSTGGEEKHQITYSESYEHVHELYTTYEGELHSESVSALVESATTWTNKWRRMGAIMPYSAGENQPHNNMPPYYVINIWRRTA